MDRLLKWSDTKSRKAGRFGLLLFATFVLLVGMASVVQADIVTLYPTTNTVVGTVTTPTNAYTDDGAGALVSANASNLQLKGFNSTDLGTISNVTVWVKYKTTAAPSNDTYAFDAAIDGATFSSSIVAASLVDQAAYTTASLSLGALTWTDVGTLAVRGVTVKTGPADAFSLDYDVAYLVVTYTPAAVNDPMLHNSISTASSYWPIAQSGKAVDGWGIPGAKYGEIVCTTCHAKGTGNIKRIKTSLVAPDGADQFPIQAAAGTVNFQATSGANSFGDDGRAVLTSSNMICEACHSQTAVHRYDSSTGVADFNHKNANQTDCIACHEHSGGFKQSGCDSCHGDPPIVGTPGSAAPTTGLAYNPVTTGSTTAGAHQTHAITLGYTCDNCHNGYTMPNGGVIDVSFSNYGSTSGTYTGQVGVTYNTGAGAGGLTCNTVYCHSTGQSANGASATPSAYSAPTWNGTAACGSCHSSSDPATGSHTAHVNDGALCTTCHSGNVHINRNIEVGVGAYTAAGAPGNGYGTCSTASCHDKGRAGLATTPTWGVSTTDCTECHAGSAIDTGSHTAHLAAGSTCISCHDDATNTVTETEPAVGHRDTNIDTDLALGYTQNKTKDSAFTTCATASCHNTGRNSGLTDTWGNTLSNCSECHPTVPTTAGHATHVGVSFAGSTIACGTCHAGSVEGTTAPTANHRNGSVNAAGYPVQANGSAYTTCTTASCHQNGLVSTTNYIATPAWDANTANCTQCHAAVPATGSHVAHVTTAGKNCSDCHTGATKDTSYVSAAHGDLNIDVAVGGYAPNKAIGSAATTCTNLACHSDGMAATGNAPQWGSAGGCAACHLSDMTTGSHTVHLAEVGVDCGNCHADAVQGTTAPTGGVHADGNVDVYNSTPLDLGYPIDRAYGSATWTTCTAASCHDKGRAGLATTPAWGVSKTDCTECHAGSAIATGSHASHLAAGSTCISCHDDATNTATETEPAAGHRDTNIDTDLALGYTQNKTKDSAFTTCATASCHNDGRNAGLTGTWGATLSNCSECHATVPTTGSHTDHMALYTCATCHTGTTQGTTAGAGHRDGTIDTAASTGLTADKLNGSAFTACGTNDCHGSNSPVWGTDLDAYDACTQCHGQLAASPTEAQKAPGGSGVDTNGDSLATDAQVGAHQIHLNPTISKVVACSACHAVPATITTAGHIDSALPAELTFSGLALGGLDGQAAVAPANSQAGCATTYCHDGAAFKNGGTWDNGTLAPTWNITTFIAGTVADCDNCHGYPPAGSHSSNTDCSLCHNGLNADDVTFTAPGKLAHVDGIVQASGGDNCSDCHAADVDGGLSGVHAKHTDVATYLSGKTISGGNYGGTGWYTTTYVNGKPNFGCGECHPAGEGVAHPTAGLNIDLDPAGETPTAGSLKLKNINGPITPSYLLRSSVTCSNIYCHSDAAATPTYATSPNWYGGTVTGNCTDCHGNSPTTNAHTLHAVGIHYDTLYDDDGAGLMTAAAAPGTDAGAAHGNSATADTIGCQSCHNNTVAVDYNAGNTLCGTCHSDTNAPTTGNEKAIISTTGSTHVNGQPDVVFASLTGFKSKAQLRNDITTVASVTSSWTRTNNYKDVAGNSYDAGQALTPGFAAGSCSSISCHNGIATPTWTSGSVGNCMTCHTNLPQ